MSWLDIKFLIKNYICAKKNNFRTIYVFPNCANNKFKKKLCGLNNVLILRDIVLINDLVFHTTEKIDKAESKNKFSKIFYFDSTYETTTGQTRYFARPIFSKSLFYQMDYLGSLLYITNINFEFWQNFSFKSFTKSGITELFNTIQEVNDRPIRISHSGYHEHKYSKIYNKFNFQLKLKDENKSLKVNRNKIEVIIPTKLTKLPWEENPAVFNLLHSLKEQYFIQFNELSVVIAINESDLIEFQSVLADHNFPYDISLHVYNYAFNYSKVMNECVLNSNSDYILFCNDDIFIPSNTNLNCFFSHLDIIDVGSVGVKLVNTSNEIIHFGIEYFEGFPRHFLDHYSPYKMKLLQDKCREVSGTTAAFMCLKRDFFLSIGMFDEEFPLEFNDVDLMLKIQKIGYSNIVCANTILVHYESLSRVKGVNENFYLSKLVQKHGPLPVRDPYLFTPYE